MDKFYWQNAAQFREGVGVELSNSPLENLLADVYNRVRGVSPSKLTLDFKLLKLDIGLSRADATLREQVRAHLIPRTTSILDEMNRLFAQARTKLRMQPQETGKEGCHDFVLIIDNMEKIVRIGGREQGEASHRALFLDGARQFTDLDCHVIYTVPLAIARACGQELMQLYGNEPIVLSNVKVEGRTSHNPWKPGRDALTKLLAERCHPYTLAQCFQPDALDFILTYCGGHVRQLLNFAREATLYTPTTPIPLLAAQKAVYKAVPTYSVGVRESDWALLAKLEIEGNQAWDTEDLARRRLMDKLFVLEYINGDQTQGGFDKAKPWYAVHPIPRELAEFKSAVQQLKDAEAKNAASTI